MSRLWRFWFKPDSGVARYAQEVLDSGWVPPLPASAGDMTTRPPETGPTATIEVAGADVEAPDLLTRFYLNQGC